MRETKSAIFNRCMFVWSIGTGIYNRTDVYLNNKVTCVIYARKMEQVTIKYSLLMLTGEPETDALFLVHVAIVNRYRFIETVLIPVFY